MTAKSYTVDIPGPDPAPHAPAFQMPDGAWDTHFHVIDTRYGFVEDRSYTPPDAPLDSLMALHATLGIQRGTFVQVSVHGTHNQAMLTSGTPPPETRPVVVLVWTLNDLIRETGTWPRYSSSPSWREWAGWSPFSYNTNSEWWP